MNDVGPLQLPIDGVLDLHTFEARDVKDLVPCYLTLCQERLAGQDGGGWGATLVDLQPLRSGHRGETMRSDSPPRPARME
jgi:hypothetical protein